MSDAYNPHLEAARQAASSPSRSWSESRQDIRRRRLNLDTASLADVLRHCADQAEAGEYHLNADEGDVGHGPTACRQLVYGKGAWVVGAEDAFVDGGPKDSDWYWVWTADDHELIRIQLPARWLPEQAS